MYTSTWFQTQLTTCIVQTETGVKDSEDTYISHDCFYNAMNSGGGWVGRGYVCVWEWMDVIVCCVWTYVIACVCHTVVSALGLAWPRSIMLR